MIVFSSLIYYAERGVYDEKLRMWMRVHHYSCPKLYRTEENDVGVFPELHSTFRVNRCLHNPAGVLPRPPPARPPVSRPARRARSARRGGP